MCSMTELGSEGKSLQIPKTKWVSDSGKYHRTEGNFHSRKPSLCAKGHGRLCHLPWQALGRIINLSCIVNGGGDLCFQLLRLECFTNIIRVLSSLCFRGQTSSMALFLGEKERKLETL